MALQNFQYDIIMREYNRRQSQVQHDLEERRAEAFARVPRLLEIDSEVAALSAQKARSLLQGEPGSVDDLKKDVAALSAERRSLLKKNGFSEDYLEPHYFCPICQDTGYTGGQKCSCFKKAEIELLYTQSNLTEDQIQEMLQFTSTSHAAAWLKRTPEYSKTWASLDENSLHRGQIEKLLKASIFDDFSKIYQFASSEQRPCV